MNSTKREQQVRNLLKMKHDLLINKRDLLANSHYDKCRVRISEIDNLIIVIDSAIGASKRQLELQRKIEEEQFIINLANEKIEKYICESFGVEGHYVTLKKMQTTQSKLLDLEYQLKLQERR